MKTMEWSVLSVFLAASLVPCLTAASLPGINWESRRLEADRIALNDVVGNGSGLHVAVGDYGVIRVSSDGGANWNTADHHTRVSLQSVTWTGSRFVAVGGSFYSDCVALSSLDGYTWSSCCLGGLPRFNAVVSSPSRVVAMGNSEEVAYADGVSWINVHPAIPEDAFSDAVWTGSQFVAVGTGGMAKTSPDGITWTRRTTGTTENLKAIAWDGSTLVAVGYNYALADPLVITSPDGIVWSDVPMTAVPDSCFLEGIAWTGSRFVAVGGYDGMLTSPDGTVWSHHSVPGATHLRSIHWDGTRLVAVGGGGIILSTASAAPATEAAWSFYSTYDALDILYGVVEADIGGGVFRTVVVGGRGTVLTSDDGGQSGADQTSGVVRDLNGITVTGLPAKRFMAVGTLGTIISSPDAVAWTLQTSGSSSYLIAADWFEPTGSTPPLVVAIGNDGTILTSPDGSSWSAAASGTGERLLGVGNGSTSGPVKRIIVVGENGTILTSVDGAVWTPRSSGTMSHLYAVTSYPDGFVAVGGHGTALTSADGISWSAGNTGGPNYLYDVVWTGNQLIAVGNNGTIFTSPDGSSWRQRYGPYSAGLRSVGALDSGRLMAVGGEGIVIVSDPGGDFAGWMGSQSPPAGQSGPDDDPNGDGVSNLTAYGFGIHAVDPAGPDDFAKLPRLVVATVDQRMRIGFSPHQTSLSDIVYVIETSTTMLPGTWTEVLRHWPGQPCSSGSLNVYSSPTSPLVGVEFPENIGERTRFLTRVRIELLSAP